mgnify:CR=1 FL=1
MENEKKIHRFNKKYENKGGFSKFSEMVNNFATLEDIGEHFGFSRQNAALLFKSFYQEDYNDIRKQRYSKREMENNKNIDNLDDLYDYFIEAKKENSARKIYYTKIVKKRAEELGLNVEVYSKKNAPIRIKINGFDVSITGTSTKTTYHQPQKRSATVYYRFAVTSKKVDYCIFVIDAGDNNYVFFVIPYTEISHLSLITLKDTYHKNNHPINFPKNMSKYAKYKNKWAQLTG